MSYGNEKTTVEKHFAYYFPYLLMKEQREREMKCGEFANYLGISVESLEDYRNKGVIPRGDTLFKIMSKCSIGFVQDMFAILGLHDRYSIVSIEKPKTGIQLMREKAGVNLS